MHVASTSIFEGPAPSARGVPRPHRLAPAPGAALPPEAALRPLRPGPAGLGRRPPPQPRLPRAPNRAAGAGLRGAAAQPGGADLLPAARPQQAALGAVAGRGPRRRPLRDRRQEPSRARRRRLRCRHHHRPLRPEQEPENPPAMPPKWAPRPEPTDLKLLADALRERATSPQEIVRGVRAALRGPRQVLRGLGATGKMVGAGMAAPSTPFNVEIGPHRRFAFVRSRSRRAEAGQGRARRHGQRRHPLGRRRRARQLPARPRPRHRGPGDAGDGAGQRSRRGGARRARQPHLGDDGAAAGLVRGPGRAPAPDQRERWAT